MRAIWLILALGIALAPAARADYLDAVELINQGDFAAAHRELLPLAEAGDPNAQYHLAFMYDYGQGVAQDHAAAAQWYRRAAEQDLAVAQFTLAGIYDSGKGVERDLVEAYRWYDRAAGNLAKSEIRDNILARRDEIGAGLTPEELARARGPAPEMPADEAATAEAAAPEEGAAPAPAPPAEPPSPGDSAAPVALAEAPGDRLAPDSPPWFKPTEPPDSGDRTSGMSPPREPVAESAPEPPQLARAPAEEESSAEEELPSAAQEAPAGDEAANEPAPAGGEQTAVPAAPAELDPVAEETIEVLAEWRRRLQEIVSHVTTPSAALHGWAKVDAWTADMRRLLQARLGAKEVARFDALSRDTVLGDPYGNFQRVTQAYLDYLATLQVEIASDPARLARG